MQLVIAEKPSVARDLARVLGIRGGGKHAIEGGGRVITWCIGHLVELEEPAAYDPAWKAWRLDTLPMLPAAFKLRPVSGTRDQLRAVRDLLRDRRFDEVVNACDAGREGELIFRYVYELAGSRLPIKRLWISSLTDAAIRAGFARLRPGVELDALADAARSRSEADWLVGMNATRAVTVSSRAAAPRPREERPPRRGRRGQSDSPLYSIGRVQTPTLAILVRRELEIRQFRPRDYWEVRGLFVPAGTPADAAEKVTATWGVAQPDGKAIDKGTLAPHASIRSRLGERPLADGIVARDEIAARGPQGAVVERLRQRRVREPPPLLFDLTSLQRTANRRYGLSATATLAAAQALYERYKILTYPRTDSRHLTTDMAKELPKLFRALAALPEYAPFASPLLATPPPISRRVFDDAKVSDHHAIVPTGQPVRLEELPRDERRIFDLVARRFLGAFHPDAEFALTDVVIRVGSDTAPRATAGPTDRDADAGADETLVTALPPPPDRYRARGRVRLVAGWQDVAGVGQPGRGSGGEAAEGDAGPTLPPLAEGQRLDGKFEILTKQTRPPPRHTEATLLGAMESAGREIADEELRAAMRDSGLGTPATRAATIETLIRRTFVARDGKNLVPTDMGIGLIAALPEKSLASPELTGNWEARLSRVARGEETRAAFMADISRYVRDVVTAIRGGAGVVRAAGATATRVPARAPAPASPPKQPTARAAPKATTLICPRCKQGALVAGKRGWGCARWREGCAFVIWFEIAGRRITDAELTDLVSKGKTRKRKWRSTEGAEIGGRLVLDLSATRDAGAARLDAPGE
ncbi:MAG TPA: DNA topoisomerase [Polyangia bacterium]|nr:DNA topoisomerase [Polyangia bacterium]